MSGGVREELAAAECPECGHSPFRHHLAGGCTITTYGPPEDGFQPAEHCGCDWAADDALLPVVERVVAEARAEAQVTTCSRCGVNPVVNPHPNQALVCCGECEDFMGYERGGAEVVAKVEAVLADLDRSTAGDVCMNHIRKDERRGCAAEIRAALGRQAGGGE